MKTGKTLSVIVLVCCAILSAASIGTAMADPKNGATSPESERPQSEKSEGEKKGAWATIEESIARWRGVAKPKDSKPKGKTRGQFTVKDRLDEFGTEAEKQLIARFKAAKVAYPPAAVMIVVIKDERLLELYAKDRKGPWKRVHTYFVLAASGQPGPKLEQGDYQVPEGFYRITALNPNSLFHVSMRLDYPNAFDRSMAAKDKRRKLGGDIMIHGGAASIGCVAVGDPAVEEIFLLATKFRLGDIKVWVAPVDFRRYPPPKRRDVDPPWRLDLYAKLTVALARLNAP